MSFARLFISFELQCDPMVATWCGFLFLIQVIFGEEVSHSTHSFICWKIILEQYLELSDQKTHILCSILLCLQDMHTKLQWMRDLLKSDTFKLF